MILKNRFNVALNISKMKSFEIFCKIVLASQCVTIMESFKRAITEGSFEPDA